MKTCDKCEKVTCIEESGIRMIFDKHSDEVVETTLNMNRCQMLKEIDSLEDKILEAEDMEQHLLRYSHSSKYFEDKIIDCREKIKMLTKELTGFTFELSSSEIKEMIAEDCIYYRDGVPYDEEGRVVIPTLT